MARCAKCGSGRRSSTARTSEVATSDVGKVPREPMQVPIRYTVNGKRFATLTAAQDYARSQPGAVIRQS